MKMLEPGSGEWERTWKLLEARIKPLGGSLDGWQYMGHNRAYGAHLFRLRAGMPGNIMRGNWIELIPEA